MANYTPYKNLELPISIEHYSIDIVNKNNMVIDSELNKLDLKNKSQDDLLASKESLNKEIERASNVEDTISQKLSAEINRAETIESEISEEVFVHTNNYSIHVPLDGLSGQTLQCGEDGNIFWGDNKIITFATEEPNNIKPNEIVMVYE